jgi:phosphoribosyl 1,2-cyclic phosphate phosphodiesterase
VSYDRTVEILFLGTGTSHGVPMIGCTCSVCRSSDPRDNRLRPSIYIEAADGTRVLVDTTPDLRQQCLRYDITRVDAVLYTHAHADHILGFDELRRFNVLTKRPMPVYGDRATLDGLQKTFGYAFDPSAPAGGGVPSTDLRLIDGVFTVGAVSVRPLPAFHGPTPVLGFRMRGFAYLTDCNQVPDATQAQLGGLEVLVLDALRHRPHPTHFSLPEALAMAARIGARQTYFTHMCHDLGHAATCATLPAGVTLAYDGLRIACS